MIIHHILGGSVANKFAQALQQIQDRAYNVTLPRLYKNEAYSAWDYDEILSKLEKDFKHKVNKAKKTYYEIVILVKVDIINGIFASCNLIDNNSIHKLNKKLFLQDLQDRKLEAFQSQTLLPSTFLSLLREFVPEWKQLKTQLILENLHRTKELVSCSAPEAMKHKDKWIELIEKEDLEQLHELSDEYFASIQDPTEPIIQHETLQMYLDLYEFFYTKVTFTKITQICDSRLLLARNRCWQIAQKYNIDISNMLEANMQQILFPTFHYTH